ncbi:ABC transporter permease subunit [Microbulbifer sp. VAAF005]|uniref:ABC transporter permease subunit n=1 Tax=Microbulbifer sp. VAAF005 TaxID=3034230 RepID=UPI0024AE11F5|nr:ABC transporter permease subunit [Microbulbifer sp. VAAF005]WHI47480.1 ABC transporter permease subunit [Microbulbifer sp. VAAF005]
MTGSIFVVAAKEFRDGLRNRWVLSICIIFSVLATGLAYFGAAAAGKVGFSSLSTTIVSLASLAVFIIPLIAMILSYDGIVGEDESGTLLLLMTYPLSRTQLLLGKMLGQGAIMAFSTLVGFGSSAVVIGLFSAHTSWSELLIPYMVFISSAVLLGWIFIAIAYVVSASVSEKSKAAGIAILIWFVFVLVFDLGLLGLLVSTEGNVNADLFPYLLLVNPTDIFRLVNITYFADQNLSGFMALANQSQFSLFGLLGGMLVWLVLPTSLALYIFSRREL